MSETLKPCPFCGSEAKIVHFSQDACYVKCENYDCMAGQKVYDTKADAIAAWNNRTAVADITRFCEVSGL